MSTKITISIYIVFSVIKKNIGSVTQDWNATMTC